MSRPTTPTPDSLADLLRHRAAADGGRVAIRFLPEADGEEASVTFGELDRRARQVAACLAARAARPGDRAVLLLPPGLGYIEAFYGCLYAGVVAVPAYPLRLPRALLRLRALVDDAGARFAFADASRLRELEPHLAGEPALAGLAWVTPEASSGSDPGLRRVAAADDLAILQYTSGSTGDPRGVMLSHRNLVRNAEAIAERAGFSGEDRLAGWLPPYHDMGLVGGLVMPVVTGMETTLFSPSAFLRRPMRWLEVISRYRATATGGPDFAYDLCARRATAADVAALDLRSLRAAFSGAERVRPETMERFSRTFAAAGFRPEAFSPCYGLAETTLAASMTAAASAPLVHEIDAAALGAGRVEPARRGAPSRALAGNGAPIAGCEVVVVDPEARTPCPPGRIGELWLRGEGVGAGYWRKPELTERVFRARMAGPADDGGATYLRTGDLGFLGEGQVFVTGRLKDVLILLGVNHYPEDIEATVLRAHPRLRPTGGAAFSVEAGGAERLVVVQEVDRPADLPVAEIAAAVREAVADEHELAVHELVLVGPGQVPRTSSGKVRRGFCRELYLAARLAPLAACGPPPGEARPAPPPALVLEIRALMASVLGVEQVGPDDDFFALGGHSLLATQLVSRVREALEVELPLTSVFEAPTAAALAEKVAGGAPCALRPGIGRVDRAGPLPLSFSQERMWFLHQLDPGGSAYNVAGAVTVEGALNVPALERSLREIVARHEILRTNYQSIDGAPRMTVRPSLDVSLDVVDLADHASPDAAAAALASEMASAPFDLARDPLVRARLFRTGNDRHALSICVHHVVADGWALGVLLSELFRVYQATAHGRPVPLAEAPIAYVDYAAWQRLHLRGDLLKREVAYWRGELAGAPMLQLATDRPRGGPPSSRGATEPLDLASGLFDRLRQRAREHDCTLFMVMLAAFEVVLHRHSGQRDFVIGVPIANRNRLAAEPLVGTLVNTLPFRARLDPDAEFAELLRTVRATALQCYAHQDIPFERLVSEVRAERSAGRSPLFPVMFDFLNVPMPVREARGLRLRPLVFSRRASQFDLSVSVLDTELGQVASIEYSTDLFEAATVRRIAGHYRSVLEAVAADPRTRVTRIPLLSPLERGNLVAATRTGPGDRPPAEPVHRLFEAQARRTPSARAVTDASGTLSYRELDRAANGLAIRLRAMGAGPGQRVAVCVGRSRAAVVALLGALKAGAAYVPIDPSHPADRIGYVLEDAEPRVIVTESAILPRLPAPPRAAVLCLDTDPGEPAVAGVDGPDADLGTAYVIYTSGSTGRPKGVEVPNGALANLLASMAHTPGMGPGDRVLSVTTISFDIAALEVFLPLVTGASVEIAPSGAIQDGKRLARMIASSGATVVQATPATWRMLVDAGWRGDGRLKVLVGGEALSRDLANDLVDRAGSVWNMYGPTETTVWSTVHRVTEADGPVPIGRPIDHTRVYVLDAAGELCPPGIPGEIHIAGAGVATGYFRRPELTAERFLPDPFQGAGARMYRTGDAGRIRADGALEFLGRLDQQVKVRGHRVEPGEIESVLREHPGVRDAVVVPREARPGDVRLTAYYVSREGPAPLRQDLRELCRRKLPDFMVPSLLVALPALPLTPSGKVDRRALPAPATDASAESPAPVPPRDALESELLELWQELLQVPVGGVGESFFDLGGHSLLVARMLARIERQTGVGLPFAAMAESPTVEHLASCIRTRQAAGTGQIAGTLSPLVEIRRRGSLSPVFCVHGAGGNVLNLYDIGRHISPERPLYGLQAPGTDGTTPPAPSIEQMARAYVAEVRSLQPHGPYHLSGYCGGGVVAYEMAQQIRASGEQVATVTLIETVCPALPREPPVLRRWARIFLTERPRGLWRRGRTRVAAEVARLLCDLRIRYHLRRGEPLPYELREFWLIKQFRRALDSYALRPFAGKVSVLRARERSSLSPDPGPDLGWRPFVTEVAVREIPGDHYSLTREPNVEVLVAELDANLCEAERA